MKNPITIKTILFLCVCCLSSGLFAQDKEWNKVTGLLEKEMTYFSGKKGHLRLLRSDYSDFTFEKLGFEGDSIVTQTHLSNRFFSEKEALTSETFNLSGYSYHLKSAQILYDYTLYFEEFPKYLFLMLEFKEDYLHRVSVKEKNTETGLFEENSAENSADRLIIPIRAKNRDKIFKAIDKYLSANFKSELRSDTYH